MKQRMTPEGGATFREIADELGVSEPRARAIYKTALRKARRICEEKGHRWEDSIFAEEPTLYHGEEATLEPLRGAAFADLRDNELHIQQHMTDQVDRGIKSHERTP